VLQVVRHERASIKADIWSYGILIWELITGEDITEYQPLSISRQVRQPTRSGTLHAICQLLRIH
jgi:serine/threonine protein kinase